MNEARKFRIMLIAQCLEQASKVKLHDLKFFKQDDRGLYRRVPIRTGHKVFFDADIGTDKKGYIDPKDRFVPKVDQRWLLLQEAVILADQILELEEREWAARGAKLAEELNVQ